MLTKNEDLQRNTTTDTTNKTMINDFTVVNENGKWIVTPKEKPNYEKFRLISHTMKEHGGILASAKNVSFAFTDEPTWLNTTELKKPEPKPQVTVVEKAKPKAETKTSTKKETSKKSTKSTSKKADKSKVQKAIEYEVYAVETVETCVAHLQKLIASHSKPEDDPSHVMLLHMLIDSCTIDDDLRTYLTHKDYDKVLNNAACEWGKKKFEENKTFRGGACSPAEILPYVLEEYKKPVIKQTTVEKAKAEAKKETKGDK